jgi:hypothetical protein
MTGVTLGQSVVPVLLFTVHGHVCPIGGSGCRGWGPRGSPSCQRAPRVPRARRKHAKGVRLSRAYVAGVGRINDVTRARTRRKPPPEAPISPETFPQGSGGTNVGSRLRATDMLSAPLAGRFYRGPYDGALADVQGAVFCHMLGTLVF